MTDIAISVDGLSKRYNLGSIGARTFREGIEQWWRRVRGLDSSDSTGYLRHGSEVGGHRTQTAEQGTEDASIEHVDEIWALNDVTFDVRRGEVLGIIGKNGAGKSTLLKILTRITEPTSGKAVIRGRVGSLLEVGTGFHPELTGRENVYLNGTILGMKKGEIDRKFDEIVDFSGVEQFIDTPVKRYSSGMFVRLGFAVAAHLEPEVLLIDEVLAVGDVGFQKKCLGKMKDVAGEGRTVLFVSHNMASVQNLCPRTCLLEGGRMTFSGETRDAITRYLQSTQKTRYDALCDRTDRKGDGKVKMVAFHAEGNSPGSQLMWGEPGRFVIQCEGRPPLDSIHVSVGVYDSMGGGVLYVSNDLVGRELSLPGNGSLVCTFPTFSLIPGSYTVNLYCTVKGILSDWVTDAASFDVFEADYYGTGRRPPTGYGAVSVPHDWRVE